MAMRVTNKIMQNNSLTNINANKALQDKLNTQMATGKKITRPSDDPVIAIRALRLRSTLSEVTQYCDKNVEDADSWLSVTEDSIDTVVGLFTDMIEQCNKGSNGATAQLNTETRQAIMDSLKALTEELYAVGNADYAGRGVFTGYRTGMKLSFQEAQTKQYTVTEQLNKSALEDITHIATGGVENATTGAPIAGVGETSISSQTVHRIRLSYDKLDNPGDAVAGTPAAAVPSITYYDTAGVEQTVAAQVVSLYDTPSPYESAETSPDGVVFIPETGELVLSQNMYERLSATKDKSGTDEDESEIRITYSKSEWKKGDLQPEHYFACESQGTKYNADWLSGGKKDDQIIAYNVGFGQQLQVNTLPGELFTHDIGRDVDDLVNILQQVTDMETVVKELEAASESGAGSVDISSNLEAAKKALTMLEDKMQTMFENGITKMQNHMATANLALTAVGTRSARLELVKNRLTSQKTNFKDLVTDNEQADVTEVAINLSSAELSYNAALMATGKVMQNSLMDFI